jgi:hypothetical protein
LITDDTLHIKYRIMGINGIYLTYSWASLKKSMQAPISASPQHGHVNVT